MDQAVAIGRSDDYVQEACNAIEIEINGLKALQASVGPSFTEAIDAILARKGRVVVTGIGKSGHIGRKIAATLASTGTPALFVHATEAAHGDLGMVTDDDIVLAISNSGESIEFQPFLQYCRRFGVTLIAMTARPDSSLGRYADIILELPRAPEACPLSLAPMTSTTLSLVYGDALAAALIRARGFKRTDFAKFHPAGKLGAQLLRMTDLLDMRPHLRSVPHVNHDAPLSEVIATITEGRRGVTAVNADGRLVGVVTDGDLRRALLQGDIFHKTATEIMGGNPLRIGADHLAVDALSMCERHKVAALFVMGVDRPEEVVGLVHLQDLLSLGIV
ncbi:KpsF/GutQ family sugar-phosphate isomerase [Acuticoccus mangrovi]|uniref:KpsF/GutQ family sugar-phosphate isomerase n=1 Tax=Acuticoccus mangrovi TaxID=2796142 RepID=A0A934IMA4_9HYPH|nr:KpsF/GutQ family sugar-phosphate isomerase [Acuticoccus mangrovi]MBJ3776447.1 KpsF/GutQ family sugar-phosphate isomerase [Acuticoccus mangrovi]